MTQRDATVGSILSAAGLLLSPTAPMTSAAPVACSSESVLAPGVVTPASAASATTLPGRCEHARESSRPERRSFGRERSHSGGNRGRGRSLSPACSVHSASVSASSSSEFSDTLVRVSAMPPPPSGRSGIGGSHSQSDRSASGRDRSPQPGPSGLGSGERSAPGIARSRLGYSGRSSPIPLGVADADRDSRGNALFPCLAPWSPF